MWCRRWLGAPSVVVRIGWDVRSLLRSQNGQDAPIFDDISSVKAVQETNHELEGPEGGELTDQLERPVSGRLARTVAGW